MSLPFPDRSWTRRKFPMLAMCIAALALAVPGARAMPAAVPVVAEPAPAAAPADLAGDVADAAAVGVPAPDAAKQEALPLALDPDAQVNLNEPADQAGAPAQPRDLAAQAPEAPASARSFSSQANGPANTLVVFDTGGEWGRLGEYYALEAGMLASHSGAVTTLPVNDYVAGLAGRYTAVVYVGSTYDGELPQAFRDDVLTGNVPVLWMGFNIWQLASTQADRNAFTARYGWDAATSYIDATDTVAKVSYNGQDLTRNTSNAAGILSPHITDAAAVNVLGQARCSGADGAETTCASVSQSSGTTFPWAVQSGNLTYIGEIPMTYMSESDRYLAAADIILDTLQPGAAATRTAAVRIEDVNPDTDPEQLRAQVDYLIGEQVPFQLAVVPIYTNPLGVDNNGTPEGPVALADRPELVDVLKHAVDNGGTLVQHGTTHQYGELNNPYSAVSTDDFEFVRSWCTAAPERTAEPVPCTKTTYVQIGGELPNMSADETADRVARGRDLFAQAGLPTPTIFETPHYAATDDAYQGISRVYSTRYERSLFYAGTLTGQRGGPYDYVGQFFPYKVSDPYGMNILPENLGNYEPEAYSQHPARTAQDIVAAAQANTVLTHANASFFFHPFYDINALKDTVAGIKRAGYTFVPATDMG
ncbi:DUF2334 domain-containing protein [Actinomyces massiliensis]|uniref:DUF2334 domain-containing protein n=1 Tax=Actinomyces massiliensis TaxID=461393 RepID=UPI00031ACBC3|nr:DUF2334 domain-containing protein [Actinomyces massiliensis]